MPANLPILRPESTVLLVVDVQERLMPVIHEQASCLAAIARLIEGAQVLGVPILATEQYPAGLGATCAPVRQCWGPVQPIEKTRFSGCVEGVVQRLAELDRPLVLIVGVETHVCVQQTVLDLLRLGYTPYLCADAVSSRRPLDRDTALDRMRQAGAVVTTTESVLFELLGEAGTEAFKSILRIVK